VVRLPLPMEIASQLMSPYRCSLCIWFDWFLISAMNRYNLVFWVFVEFTDKTLIRIVMFDRIVLFFNLLKIV
jgi:hypothetical protein